MKNPPSGDNNLKIIELVKKVKYENDQKAYDLIVEILKPYIKVFRRKFIIGGLAGDDIEQECLFALYHKVINDFNPKKGKFKTFAVLCMKRHLFSIIKGNKQHKKIAMNLALSLDVNISENNEELILKNIVSSNEESIEDQIQRKEDHDLRESKLMSRLSDFEKDVYLLYVQRYHYEEIAEILRGKGRTSIRTKAVDNALQRVKFKARNIEDEQEDKKN